MPPADSNTAKQFSQGAMVGTAWSTVSTVGKQLLSIASLATVARLLGPGAYGVMGMANLLIVFIVNFRDLGTGTAIIQRLSVNDRLLSSLFWINCLLGLLLAGVVIAASPLTARFFYTPELVPILCVISVSFWLSSCGIVHNSLLLREMRFKALASADLGAAVIGYLVALVSAYCGLGVWSLVFANIANSTATTSFYWLATSWRPSRNFDRVEVKSVMNFSLNLSGFGIVNYASRNADNIIVGRILGQVALGNYQMAYNLMLTPLQNISAVIAQVTLPAFSQIQEETERFRIAYIRTSSIVALITFPIMGGLGVVADPLIRAVLGPKWLGAIPIFEILAPVGLVQSVETLVGMIYMARGRTDWMFRWGAFRCLIIVAAFLVGVRFGAVGVAMAYLIVYLAVLAYPGFAIPFRLIDLKVREFASALMPQTLLTVVMVCVCWIWLRGLAMSSVSNVWFRLASASALGTAVYLIGLRTIRPPVLQYLVNVMKGSQNPIILKSSAIVQRMI